VTSGFALAIAAGTVGSLHTLAPDHWVPFAAVARARGWSVARTTGVTIACGFGHVTVSAAMGLLALFLSLQVFDVIGRKLEAAGGVLLIAFGLAYAAWGLRRAAGTHLHGHTHVHYDHVHSADRASALSLFLLFSADPCVAVIPLIVAGAPLGAAKVLGIVVVYEVATLATMVALVLPARAAAQAARGVWLNRYGDAAAGGLIAATGLLVTVLGL
jgi:hypothetical protein